MSVALGTGLQGAMPFAPRTLKLHFQLRPARPLLPLEKTRQRLSFMLTSAVTAVRHAPCRTSVVSDRIYHVSQLLRRVVNSIRFAKKINSTIAQQLTNLLVRSNNEYPSADFYTS